MLKEYALEAKYDRCKSFYGRAKVQEENGEKRLISYQTKVCSIDSDGNFHRHWGNYSVTTMRHVNEFVRQNGINGGGKAWWCALPVEDETYAYDFEDNQWRYHYGGATYTW